jgi:hypothetical protein
MNFRLPPQLERFVAREATIQAIKDEEIARMVALAARNGGQLTDGQRRACLERFADRIAAARTSVYKRTAATILATLRTAEMSQAPDLAQAS